MQKRSQYLLIAASAVGILAMGVAGWAIGRLGAAKPQPGLTAADQPPAPIATPAVETPAPTPPVFDAPPGQLTFGNQTQLTPATPIANDGTITLQFNNGQQIAGQRIVLNTADGPAPAQPGRIANIRRGTVALPIRPNANPAGNAPAPVVISGGNGNGQMVISGGGNGATAFATVDANGNITGITITNPGVAGAPPANNFNGTITVRGAQQGAIQTPAVPASPTPNGLP